MPEKEDLVRYKELALKRLNGTLTPEESGELIAWLNADDGLPLQLPEGFADSGEELEQRIWAKLSADPSFRSTPIIPLWRRRLRPASAAAILALLAGVGWYWIRHRESSAIPRTTTIASAPSPAADIPAPSGNKAVLTLSDGKRIELDSAGNRPIAMQGGTQVVASGKNGLTYKAAEGAGQVQYNTLTVPRGSSITHIILSDGTRIWLNVASSLTYPVAFTGNERRVQISGEAYFEVAANADRPFIVERPDKDMQVQVLGTHFDINMYEEEAAMKVTLLEGSVNVKKGSQAQLLRPGQQVRIEGEQLLLEKNVDLEVVMGWKNGQFWLKGTDLAVLMRQIARWYDVDIQFEGVVPSRKFGGAIGNDASLSSVLLALKENGVNCTLEGRKIIIRP